MKLEASDKVAVPQKRPYIKKGFYHARLAEIRPKKNESKYGKKIVLIFDILDQRYQKNGKFLQLATEVYSEYKQEDNSYRTAITPNSNITQVFMALGWKFSNQGLDTNDFIGAEAEVLVEDYEYDYTDPATNKTEKTKASTINDVNPWEDEQPGVVEEKIEG